MKAGEIREGGRNEWYEFANELLSGPDEGFASIAQGTATRAHAGLWFPMAGLFLAESSLRCTLGPMATALAVVDSKRKARELILFVVIHLRIDVFALPT